MIWDEKVITLFNLIVEKIKTAENSTALELMEQLGKDTGIIPSPTPAPTVTIRGRPYFDDSLLPDEDW